MRPNLAYAHYYSTPNLGDKIQLRKAVVALTHGDRSGFHFEAL